MGLRGHGHSAAQARRGQNTRWESAWKPSRRGCEGRLAHRPRGRRLPRATRHRGGKDGSAWPAEPAPRLLVPPHRPAELTPRLLAPPHRPVGAGAWLPGGSEVRLDQALDTDPPQERAAADTGQSESTATGRAGPCGGGPGAPHGSAAQAQRRQAPGRAPQTPSQRGKAASAMHRVQWAVQRFPETGWRRGWPRAHAQHSGPRALARGGFPQASSLRDLCCHVTGSRLSPPRGSEMLLPNFIQVHMRSAPTRSV